MNSALIQLRNLLIVRNGMNVLDIPDLSIEEGRIVSLVGPNGAGKSTLLLSLMQLVRTDGGEVLYRGEKIKPGSQPHQYRRQMALVFQEPLLFSATVYQNIASGLKLRGIKRDEIRITVERTASLLGIAHLIKRPAGTLSGGEAQRTNLARALALNPELLLMDEPFSSLDAPSRETFIADLERIIRSKGITAVVATHDRAEAIRLADEIIVLNRGRIEQAGTPGEITKYPNSEFVATFMGTETILSGRVTGSDGGIITVSVNGSVIEAVGEIVPGGLVTFCVHPENIILSERRPESSARNIFRGHIVKTVPMGLYRKVYFDCGFILVAYVSNRSVESMDIREGKEMTASFKATSVHTIKIQ
jgi:tungstate transport system ATP-binding protein